MTTIAIPLSDDQAARLRLRAEQTGLSPEEFLRRRVEQLLVCAAVQRLQVRR